jgi:hypothetical protein
MSKKKVNAQKHFSNYFFITLGCLAIYGRLLFGHLYFFTKMYCAVHNCNLRYYWAISTVKMLAAWIAVILLLVDLASTLDTEEGEEDPRDRFNRLLQGFGFTSRLGDSPGSGSSQQQQFTEVSRPDQPLLNSRASPGSGSSQQQLFTEVSRPDQPLLNSRASPGSGSSQQQQFTEASLLDQPLLNSRASPGSGSQQQQFTEVSRPSRVGQQGQTEPSSAAALPAVVNKIAVPIFTPRIQAEREGGRGGAALTAATDSTTAVVRKIAVVRKSVVKSPPPAVIGAENAAAGTPSQPSAPGPLAGSAAPRAQSTVPLTAAQSAAAARPFAVSLAAADIPVASPSLTSDSVTTTTDSRKEQEGQSGSNKNLGFISPARKINIGQDFIPQLERERQGEGQEAGISRGGQQGRPQERSNQPAGRQGGGRSPVSSLVIQDQRRGREPVGRNKKEPPKFLLNALN